MADYVVITTQFTKAWATLSKNTYNSSLSDTYCPKKSEIVDTFKCKVRNSIKTWDDNELVATQDVYATYASCTCNNCYKSQTTCNNCNTAVCACNSQSDSPCTGNCNDHETTCNCQACNAAQSDKSCDTNCPSHTTVPSCTSCNTAVVNPCDSNCNQHKVTCDCNTCNGTVSSTCNSNCTSHTVTCSCVSCNNTYCNCQSGQTNYECGGIEEVK